jgi:hypothetical protein
LDAARTTDLLSILPGIMTQPTSSARGNPLIDLVCVAVLGLLLWLTAQSVASITRHGQLPGPAHAAPAHEPAPAAGH